MLADFQIGMYRIFDSYSVEYSESTIRYIPIFKILSLAVSSKFAAMCVTHYKIPPLLKRVDMQLTVL